MNNCEHLDNQQHQTTRLVAWLHGTTSSQGLTSPTQEPSQQQKLPILGPDAHVVTIDNHSDDS
jgi:hypothetical protein